ncbi:ATPase [Synergistales bacterium]|nr:ATPase [Synergistales bacterium]
MYYERTLENVIKKASQTFKVIMLTGMRQVGKTTLLKDLAGPNRKYLTLDDSRTLKMAKEDPYLFFQSNEAPILIDEVQYAPELFSHIKMLVDGTDKNGLVWMTGSQQFLMMKGVSESLAGRMAIIDLHGFSLYELEKRAALQRYFIPSPEPAEILTRKNAEATYEIIWRGSLPGIAVEDKDWGMFYSSYIKTYIERDVRQLTNIGSELAFFNFLKSLAARTAQELNLSAIAVETGVSVNTAKSWLSVLRASGIIYLLQPYHQNITKRIIKRPKLYFIDTGLAAYLTEWSTPGVLASGAMAGPFFETFAIVEILKSYAHNGCAPSMYYYRDTNKVEIDLIIERDGMLYPVEIKKTATPDKKMIKNFAVLERFGKPVGYGALICLTDKPFPLTENAMAISLWDI